MDCKRSTKEDLLFFFKFVRKRAKRLQRRLKRKINQGIQWLDYNLFNIVLNMAAIFAAAILVPLVVAAGQEAEAEKVDKIMENYTQMRVGDYIYLKENSPEEQQRPIIVIKSGTEEFHQEEHIIHTQESVEGIELISSVGEIPLMANLESIESPRAETPAESQIEAETETQAEAKTRTETQPQTEPETEAPTKAETQPQTEAQTEAETEPKETQSSDAISSNQRACNEYADALLEEGVITEEEAEMIKARGNGPENPWISNVSENVIGNLADVMYAEAGNLISLEGWARGKRALLLVGSVVCNRYHYPTLGNCDTLAEIISLPGAYASRTQRRMGKRYYISDGYAYIEDWARDLYTYGPIGPRTLIWQGPRQGIVYEVIHGEYFGVDKNPPF